MLIQMIELLIFAGIAFFIINKLITILGSTSNNDPTKHKSYFGENNLKDVTATSQFSNSTITTKSTVNIDDLKELIVEENLNSIIDGLKILEHRMKSFKVRHFLHSAKMAFKMIIECGHNQDKAKLVKLVDKRYLEQFQPIVANYGTCLSTSNLIAKISEIYTFGNNIFIKILFTGENVTSQMKNIQEEWTFSKNLIVNDMDWFLTNIDQL